MRKRRKYYDQVTNKELIFLTNNTTLTTLEIALLCKKPWEIELFFNWMKQHLRIKSSWRTTLNVVKTPIYCTIIAYYLVATVGNKLKVDRLIYEILQILNISLLKKAPVREILTISHYRYVKELNNKHLIITGF